MITNNALDSKIIFNLILDYPLAEKCLYMKEAKPPEDSRDIYRQNTNAEFKTFIYKIQNHPSDIEAKRLAKQIKMSEDHWFLSILEKIAYNNLDNDIINKNNPIQDLSEVEEIKNLHDAISFGLNLSEHSIVNIICNQNTYNKLESAMTRKTNKKLYVHNKRLYYGIISDILVTEEYDLLDDIIYFLPSSEKLGIFYTMYPLHINNNGNLTQTISIDIKNPEMVLRVSIRGISTDYIAPETDNDFYKFKIEHIDGQCHGCYYPEGDINIFRCPHCDTELSLCQVCNEDKYCPICLVNDSSDTNDHQYSN